MKKLRNITLTCLLAITGFITASGFTITHVCENDTNVFIDWSLPNDTCEDFLNYKLYARPNQTSNYILIDKINDYYLNSYIHNNAALTSEKWEYFIVMVFKCGLIDSMVSDTVAIDKIAPVKIEIDTVSVSGKSIVIGWKQASDNDVMGYILYYEQNSKNIIIDTIYGKNNTFYVDSGNTDPSSTTKLYRIIAIDSCFNLSLFSDAHNTILLSTKNNYCKGSISLSWNKYSAWSENNVEYQVLTKKKGENEFKIAGSTNGDITNYELTGLDNEAYYDIILRAMHKTTSYHSSSNMVKIKTHFVSLPSEIYLQNVTVNSNFDGMEISWLVDREADIKSFNLYKQEQGKVEKLEKSIGYQGNKIYTEPDNDVNINSTIYNYRVSLIDSCDIESMTSNTAHNILITLSSENSNNKLLWNLYEGWLGGIKFQEIFEKTDNTIFASVGPAEVEYFNNLDKSNMKGKEFCFYVEAVEGNNKYGSGQRSKSNYTCITGEHIVFFPTAVKLNSDYGENRYFSPRGMLIDSMNSRLEIYNRWGQRIWYSTPGELKWDGKINNGKEFAPSGVYLYVAVINGRAGETKRYSGTLTLLR